MTFLRSSTARSRLTPGDLWIKLLCNNSSRMCLFLWQPSKYWLCKITSPFFFLWLSLKMPLKKPSKYILKMYLVIQISSLFTYNCIVILLSIHILKTEIRSYAIYCFALNVVMNIHVSWESPSKTRKTPVVLQSWVY